MLVKQLLIADYLPDNFAEFFTCIMSFDPPIF